MHHAIGLDLGGSSAKVALVAASGEILAAEQVPIPATADPETVLAPIGAAVDRLCAGASRRGLAPVAVGCGFSGSLDADGAKIELNNTPALAGFALKPWLQMRFGLPVTVDNDACAAAMAETWHLAEVRGRRVVFVTVGSGIGVVLVLDGAIVRVMKGVTGDAGHLIVQHGSREQCPVGCHGCLETVASARAIARYGKQAARDGNSPMLAI
ncbi:MAG: ROK family protein, partial [Chloroflexota bacterium]